MPTGPTVRVMPSPGKPYEVFMADDGVCREWAQYQIGGTSPGQTANENLAAGAVVGTVVPPFPKAGRWTEFEGKSSDRYETHHFMYIVPNESPAIELYVTTDKRNEAPDGVFEVGLVKGFVRINHH